MKRLGKLGSLIAVLAVLGGIIAAVAANADAGTDTAICESQSGV
jgi:hypothetical protein